MKKSVYQEKIDISLNCSEDIFQSNFNLFIQDRKDGRCSSQTKKKLSGVLKGNEISLWYNPKCFRQPHSLPIAQGKFHQLENATTKIELDIFIEGHYPATYFIVGAMTYILVLLLFGVTNSWTFNFWTIETILLIAVPFLTLIVTLYSFKNGVNDAKKEIIKYLRILSKRRN